MTFIRQRCDRMIPKSKVPPWPKIILVSPPYSSLIRRRVGRRRCNDGRAPLAAASWSGNWTC